MAVIKVFFSFSSSESTKCPVEGKRTHRIKIIDRRRKKKKTEWRSIYFGGIRNGFNKRWLFSYPDLDLELKYQLARGDRKTERWRGINNLKKSVNTWNEQRQSSGKRKPVEIEGRRKYFLRKSIQKVKKFQMNLKKIHMNLKKIE